MNWKWLAITKAVKEGIKKEGKKTKETQKAFEGKNGRTERSRKISFNLKQY